MKKNLKVKHNEIEGPVLKIVESITLSLTHMSTSICTDTGMGRIEKISAQYWRDYKNCEVLSDSDKWVKSRIFNPSFYVCVCEFRL